MQPRAPRKEDEKYVPTAIRMLTCIACLNYAMCDLEDELSAAGLLRHAVKRSFGMAQVQVQRVHQQAYEMLGKASDLAARQYNDKLDEGWRAITSAVALDAPERAYNIVVALCRLIEKQNSELSGRYDFAPARVLYRIPGMLNGVEICDYKIDRIVEIALKD
ncbi:MAG: hypothetical protein NC548_18880 [Lachnospiraceae bacterium]|nr:hypothetical protein [Lachnospiraceae bacterium]